MSGVVGWVEHTGVVGKVAAWDAQQLDQLHEMGWTDTTAPVGDDGDFDFRDLTTIDVGSLVAPLIAGLVPVENLPAGVGGDYSDADAAALWSTEPAVTYAAGKLTIDFPASGLDTEAVQDLIASTATAGSGVTVTYDDTAGTLTFALSLEYLQDQVAAMFGGTHSGATVAYDDSTGKLTLTVSGASTPADDSITQAMLQDGIVGAAQVVADEVPVFDAEGAVALDDGVSRDAGTAATHGDVDDLAATTLGAMYAKYVARGLLVANEDGTPVALQGTSGVDAAPALVGDTWQMKPLTELGGDTGGDGGTGTAITQTLFDPYPANARKFSAGLADAIADNTHAVCKIGFFGDSVTEVMYGAYVDRFRKRLARFNRGSVPFDFTNAPTGAPGWVSGSTDTSPVNSFQFGLTTGTAGSGGNNVEVAKGLALAAYQLASGSVLTLQDAADATASPTFDYAEFHYTAQNNAGTRDLEIRIDGSLVQTIHTVDSGLASGAFDSGRTYVWTGTLTGHTITVTGAGGSAAIFDGVYLGDQRERVRVYNGGNSGTKYSSYLTATAPGALQAAKNLDLDLVISAWGINDYADGLTTFGNNMTTWFANVRTVLPDVSQGCIIPYATQSRADWASYVAMMKTKAAAASVPWLDMSWPIKTNASTTDPRDLVFSDNTHQNASFGELYAQELGKFVLGDHIDWTRVLSYVLGGGQAATFTSAALGIATFAGLIVKSPPTGGLSKWLGVHDSGSASSGLIGEFGWTGRGATGLLGASGVNMIAGFRARTQGTLTDSSAPLDVEVWSAPSGSTTIAKRASWLAGGGLALFESSEPGTPTDGTVQWARDNSGVTEWCFKGPDGVVHVIGDDSGSGTVDGVDAELLIASADDDADGFLFKAPTATWGDIGVTSVGGDPDYGKGQVLAYHRYDAASTDPNDTLLFRLDKLAGMGLGGGIHNAYGLRQTDALFTPSIADWVQLFANAHGIVVDNPTTSDVATWDKAFLLCTDVRGGSPVNVFEVGNTAIYSRHTGGLNVTGGWLAAAGSLLGICTYVGPPTTTTQGVVVRGQASHTATLFEAQRSDATPVFSVDPNGLVAAPNVAQPTATRYKLLDHFERAGAQTTNGGQIGGSAAWALLSGTGAGTSQVGATTSANGVLACSAGTTTTGYCAECFLHNPIVFTAATSDIWVGGRVQIPTLSTTGEQFAVRMGLMNSFTGTAPTEGLYFRVNHGDSVWHAIAVRAGTETDTATAVTATAGSWVNWRIRYAPNGSWTFYLGNSSVASGSTNKPTDSTGLYVTGGIAKAAGTTARFVYFDHQNMAVNSDIDIEQTLPLAV